MASGASPFPDLDVALTVSRVEVVSNVEIETLKVALRWLYDQAQNQRKAGETADAQKQIDDLTKTVQEQSARVTALQEQQEKLLQSCQEAQQALQPLQELPDALRKLQDGQDSSTGVQEQLAGLHQQLDSLTQGQSKLGLEVAALQTDAPHFSALSAEVRTGSQAEQQAEHSSPVAAQSADSTSAAAIVPSTRPSGEHGQSTLPLQPSSALGLQADDALVRRVDALAAEVARLGAAMGTANQQPSSTPPQPSVSGRTEVSTSAVLPASPGSVAAPGATGPGMADKQDRQTRDLEERLAGVADALAAVREQVVGQGNSLADFKAAEAELRRALADKAGLADVQAVLQSQSAPPLLPVPTGDSAEAGMVGAINGLGAKVAGLEALLPLAQQRIADKADSADVDSLRNALSKLKAAIGDNVVPEVISGTKVGSQAVGPDAADVVPAETESSSPQSLPAGTAVQSTRAAAAAPVGSLNARLATIERFMSAANKLTDRVSASGLSNAALVVLPSSHAGDRTSSSSAESDLVDRVAALEAQLSQLRQPDSIPSLKSIKSLGLVSNPSLAGGNSAQLVQSDSALRECLSQLQQQIDALMSGKANKADLDSLQLHAAILGGGSNSGAVVAKDDSNVHGSATTSSGSAGSGNMAGGMAGLVEAVQKMVAGKADKEDVQGLRRLLGDKVNLADHQAAYNNLERCLLDLQPAPSGGRSTAGLLGAGPAPRSSPRGGSGFVAVRPARRTLQDENAAPGSELAGVHEQIQQLKAAVEVLTNATHLMAIPNATSTLPAEPGRRATGEVRVSEVVHGGISTTTPAVAPGATAAGGSVSGAGAFVNGGQSAATAVGGSLLALPAAATAAATAAAVAIAGLRAPLDGSASKPSAFHPLAGSKQKQGLGKDGLATGQTSAAKSPAAPAPTPTPRADGSSPEQLPYQGSSVGVEDEVTGPLQELVSSMRTGQLGHKMNDSDIHDQLAHRLTALEKLVKKLTQQPQGTVHMAGAPGGKGPDERLLRRLGSDLAIVKKRLDEIAPPKDPGALMMMREGDHAMLAGKPLQGYRCMACDRPLAKLDPDMGGFIPGPHMPISVTTEPSKNNGVVVLVKDGAGGRAVGARKGPPPSQHSRTAVHAQSPRSGEDPVGPQNWYKEAGGQPAQALPKEDVGPHLPPGGWRAGTSQGSRVQTVKGVTRPGTQAVGEGNDLVAWDTQATVPLPDINAKNKA